MAVCQRQFRRRRSVNDSAVPQLFAQRHIPIRLCRRYRWPAGTHRSLQHRIVLRAWSWANRNRLPFPDPCRVDARTVNPAAAGTPTSTELRLSYRDRSQRRRAGHHRTVRGLHNVDVALAPAPRRQERSPGIDHPCGFDPRSGQTSVEVQLPHPAAPSGKPGTAGCSPPSTLHMRFSGRGGHCSSTSPCTSDIDVPDAHPASPPCHTVKGKSSHHRCIWRIHVWPVAQVDVAVVRDTVTGAVCSIARRRASAVTATETPCGTSIVRSAWPPSIEGTFSV